MPTLPVPVAWLSRRRDGDVVRSHDARSANRRCQLSGPSSGADGFNVAGRYAARHQLPHDNCGFGLSRGGSNDDMECGLDSIAGASRTWTVTRRNERTGNADSEAKFAASSRRARFDPCSCAFPRSAYRQLGRVHHLQRLVSRLPVFVCGENLAVYHTHDTHSPVTDL